MSGVLHPTGPEPARTYWVRRGVLLAVVLLLALGVVFAVASLTKAAVATAPPPPLPPAASQEQSTSPSVGGGPSTPISAPTSSVGSSSRPSASASSSASSAAKPSASTGAQRSASGSASATAKPSPTTTVVGTPDCRPADLRVTLKGDRSLSPGQNTTFRLSLVNGGERTCLVSVTDKNFGLKIYSGKDRIWSSQDCAKRLDAFDKKLAAKGDVTWKMTWDGERSVKGKTCQRGTDTPLAGTYWATAQLKGADPVQLRMIIS